MTINLQTLKCGERGSGALQRSGLNQYACAHCGSVPIVEDNVSDRLEWVLEQVKEEAGRRLAVEQSARGRSAARSMAPRTIPSEGLRLEARQVLAGSGSPAQPWLLVTARNERGTAIERPKVNAILYDRDNRIGEHSESMPIGTLMPRGDGAGADQAAEVWLFGLLANARKVPIAARDYRIDYSLTEGAQQAKKRVLTSSSRVIRAAGAPETQGASQRLSSADLLADGGAGQVDKARRPTSPRAGLLSPAT